MPREKPPALPDDLAPTLADGPPPRDEALAHAETLAAVVRASAGKPAPFAGDDPLSRYEIGEKLGSGGMGDVLLAHDTRIERDVALKRMRPVAANDEAGWQRFLREARVQGQLGHPAVVPVHDLGTTADGSLYFTMRRLHGRTLEDVLAERGDLHRTVDARYSRRRLLNAFVSVCLAVDFAHSKGVVHRDLKPANVMLGDFGEVYVLDWGIAKVMGGAAAGALKSAQLTVDGSLMGTPGYMAPEQLLGQHSAIDARTDVYSLGAILFEILAGQPLVPRAGVNAIAAVLDGLDAHPANRASDVPPELDMACARALAPRADDRFPTARALADAVERYLDGDRDLERRRALAETLMARADAATERAFAPEISAEEAQSARLEATRSVMGVLALDPEHARARATLARLLVEMPAQLPRDALHALDASETAARRQGARIGFWIFFACLLSIPVTVSMGVRSWPPVAVQIALTFFLAGLTFWMGRSGKVSSATVGPLVTLSLAACALFSCWLGPFVLAPAAVAATTLMFSVQCHGAERSAYIALGGVASLIPFAIEWLHLAPAAYAVHADHVVLFARALTFHPTMSILSLAGTAVGFTVGPALYLGAIKDSLRAAEKKLFLQTWHLEKLTQPASG